MGRTPVERETHNTIPHAQSHIQRAKTGWTHRVPEAIPLTAGEQANRIRQSSPRKQMIVTGHCSKRNPTS